MPAEHVRLFPDPILRSKAGPVTKFDEDLAEWVRRLARAMKAQTAGIGIAAPQIGISKRLALVDVSQRIPGAQKLVLVNPVILQVSEPLMRREGCMSLPDYTGYVKRYQKIYLRYRDLTGELWEESFEGLQAVCIQHEVDHLDGILFFDRVASLKKDILPRKI